MSIFNFVVMLRNGDYLGTHTSKRRVLNKKSKLIKAEIDRDTSDLYQLENLLLKDNMHYVNIILILEDINYSNFYILLRSLGITIYGGNSTRRHLLSTVHKGLVMFLQLLEELSVSSDVIYKSYTDVEMFKDKHLSKISKLLNNLRNSKDFEELEKNISIYGEHIKGLSEHANFVKKFNCLIELYLTLTHYNTTMKHNNIELSHLSEKVESHLPKIRALKNDILVSKREVQT